MEEPVRLFDIQVQDDGTALRGWKTQEGILLAVKGGGVAGHIKKALAGIPEHKICAEAEREYKNRVKKGTFINHGHNI